MRNNLLMMGIAVALAVTTAFGTALLALDSRMFEAQAQMVTQEQFRFQLEQSNDRIEDRLDSIESLIWIILERDNASIR